MADTNKELEQDADQEQDKVTFTESVVFYDDGNEINFQWGLGNGREEVFVNGEHMASKTNYINKTSRNSFSIGETDYYVEQDVKSFIWGDNIITLCRNGTPVQRKQVTYRVPVSKVEKPGFRPKFSTALYMTVLILLISLLLEISLIIPIIVISIILAGFYLYINRRFTFTDKPVIEDIEI